MKLIFQIAAAIVLAFAFITQPLFVGLILVIMALVWGANDGLSKVFDGPKRPDGVDDDLIGNRLLKWLRGK